MNNMTDLELLKIEYTVLREAYLKERKKLNAIERRLREYEPGADFYKIYRELEEQEKGLSFSEFQKKHAESSEAHSGFMQSGWLKASLEPKKE